VEEEISDKEMKSSVNVVCRVKPLEDNDSCIHFKDKKKLTVCLINERQIKEEHEFNLDYIFDYNDTQETVYNIAAKPLIHSVLNGFNTTLIAYGQTSSGKTYTMQGNLDNEEERGIIPRMVDTIFEYITQADDNVEFTLKVSMLEIYNERVRDLLNTAKDNLAVREDKQHGVFIEELTEIFIENPDEIHNLIKKGSSNRVMAETKMNTQSSRSHFIFILSIIINDTDEFTCKKGKVYVVDLAGSETNSKSGATGQTLKEAKNINKSLTTFRRVVMGLGNKKKMHIPYRDSKLTRILQQSLGGNSKTSLILTVNPSTFNSSETLATCRFGLPAKNIEINAKVNKEATISELKQTVQNLEQEMILKNKRIINLESMLMKKRSLTNNYDKENNQVRNESKGHSFLIKFNAINKLKEELLIDSFEEQQDDIDILLSQLRYERRKNKLKQQQIQQLQVALQSQPKEDEEKELIKVIKRLEREMKMLKEKDLNCCAVEILKRKICQLERSLNCISKDYCDKVNKITYLELELKMKVNQIERKNRKIQEQETLITRLREEVRNLNAVNKELKEIIRDKMPIATTTLESSNRYKMNITKTIRGKRHNSNIPSFKSDVEYNSN